MQTIICKYAVFHISRRLYGIRSTSGMESVLCTVWNLRSAQYGIHLAEMVCPHGSAVYGICA